MVHEIEEEEKEVAKGRRVMKLMVLGAGDGIQLNGLVKTSVAVGRFQCWKDLPRST